MSPSKFLLSKGHQSNCDVPLQGELRETWRVGHPKFLPFKLGQLVMVKVHRQGNLTIYKLSPTFKGPYEVTHINNNGVTYQLRDRNSGEVFRVHHTQLRLYKEAPKYIIQNPYYQSKMEGLRPSESSSDFVVAPIAHPVSSRIIFGSDSRSSESSHLNESFSDNDESSFSGFDENHDVSPQSRDSVISAPIKVPKANKVPNSKAIHLCKGCGFEAEVECGAAFNDTVFDDANLVQTVLNDSIAARLDSLDKLTFPPLQDLDAMYRLTVLDWAETDWELSSVNSALMIDEFHERADSELVDAMSGVPIVGESRDKLPCVTNCCEPPIEISPPSLAPQPRVEFFNIDPAQSVTCKLHRDDLFEGFDSDLDVNKQKVNTLRKILSDCHTDTEIDVRRTRSRGPVLDFPNVMSKPIERIFNPKSYNSS